jgi:SH3-like domain-containing protein
MKKITFIISIALLTACGGKKTETSATENAQPNNVVAPSSSEGSVPNSEASEPQEKMNCGPSRILVTWDDPDKSGTNIRNSPGGKVIAKINPSDFPDGCMMEIVEASNGWFRINGGIEGPGDESDIALPGNVGWIHGSVVTTGTRNYGGQKINILDEPNNGKIVGSITTEVYGLRILDLCGNWVKISYNGMTGWVSSDWLCGVPWTTCP